jgi:uracil-DNA glycosylase
MATRTTTRIVRPGAQEWVPPSAGVPELRVAATACHGCELWERRPRWSSRPATPPRPSSWSVSSPGNAYYTNAVKHFRFQTRGKRRIHEKPDLVHVNACKPWLSAELAVVRPRVVVVLGATAASALMGRDFRVTEQRRQIIQGDDHAYVATVHSSSILRTPAGAREQARSDFVADLRVAAGRL